MIHKVRKMKTDIVIIPDLNGDIEYPGDKE